MTAGIAGQMSLYDLLGSPEPASLPSRHSAPSPAAPAPQAESSSAPASQSAPAPQPESDPPSALESPPAHPDSLLPALTVEVIRSRRRKKTAQAYLVGSTLEIRIPAACNADEERYFINHFQQKFERSRVAAVVDLDERARRLAGRYGLPQPTSIRWVSNQKHQWGSCTPSEGSIRLSDRMAGFPGWVVDYVVMHELAHLIEGDHSPAFWALVNRYPKTERARGYLMAKDGV